MNYKSFFKEKRIAVVGLGPHGEMVADIKFLLKIGAQVSFFDMRSEARLQGYIAPLKEAGLAEYTFGKVPEEELLKAELIIISPEISRKSLFLKKAAQAGIRIEYPDVLFLKLAPSITLIGVMGECGKTTVAQMIYKILKQAFAEHEAQGLFFIDPDLSHGALTHLKKIKAGDVVLARITEEMMNEYAEARVVPHVAVITSLTSKAIAGMKKAFDILEHQTYNNFIVAPDSVIDVIKTKTDFVTKAKMLRTRPENSALALQTGELFKVSPETGLQVISAFGPLRGHQELVKKAGGIEFYNDSASVTPKATIAALRALSFNKDTILLLGGAYTGYDYSELIKEIPLHTKAVVLISGSGSIGLRKELESLEGVEFFQSKTMEDALILAKGIAKKGDKILFSPGFEAIGVHISRKERGEKFVKAVRSL